MKSIIKTLSITARTGLVMLLALTLPVLAEEAQTEDTQTAGRAVAAQIEAKVTAIDLKTREISLETADGVVVTVVAPEKVIKLEDVTVGDQLEGTFYAALYAELRAPTAEELAEPWKVLEDGSVSVNGASPGVAASHVIRAVVTIEGLNPETGVVTIKDSRGKLHSFSDVRPERMTGVSVGQTAVVVFTQAVALTLEKKSKAAQ